eukprot:6685938-Pyramimonas_sp.AAC.1
MNQQGVADRSGLRRRKAENPGTPNSFNSPCKIDDVGLLGLSEACWSALGALLGRLGTIFGRLGALLAPKRRTNLAIC